MLGIVEAVINRPKCGYSQTAAFGQKQTFVVFLNDLGLWLCHAAHWQTTNFTQVRAIGTTSESFSRYALPGFGIRLIVFGCGLFAAVAIGARKIVVSAHCHFSMLRW